MAKAEQNDSDNFDLGSRQAAAKTQLNINDLGDLLPEWKKVPFRHVDGYQLGDFLSLKQALQKTSQPGSEMYSAVHDYFNAEDHQHFALGGVPLTDLYPEDFVKLKNVLFMKILQDQRLKNPIADRIDYQHSGRIMRQLEDYSINIRTQSLGVHFRIWELISGESADNYRLAVHDYALQPETILTVNPLEFASSKTFNIYLTNIHEGLLRTILEQESDSSAPTGKELLQVSDRHNDWLAKRSQDLRRKLNRIGVEIISEETSLDFDAHTEILETVQAHTEESLRAIKNNELENPIKQTKTS